MESLVLWKYLDNVWILAGLALVILVCLLKLLSVGNLSDQKTRRQAFKGINYLFVLGITGMALGTLFSQYGGFAPSQQTNADLFGTQTLPNQELIDAQSQSQSQSISHDTGSASGAEGFNPLFHSLPDRTRSERPHPSKQKTHEDLESMADISNETPYYEE